MNKLFSPLLACNLNSPIFPYLGSPKLDGIRCVIPKSIPSSRTLKPIPNIEIQDRLSELDLKGLDGELIVGDPKSPTVFKDSTSFVMSKNKVRDDWKYYIFDDFTDPNLPFNHRFELARKRVLMLNSEYVTIVPHYPIYTFYDLKLYEDMFVHSGFEGIMLRSLTGRYKFGRATIKDNILLKLKRFSDGEAEVIGYTEMMTNNNPKEINELGNSKRSSNKDNMIPAGTLGSLVVIDLKSGVEFDIGSGFTLEERDIYWSMKNSLEGMIVKYKFFEVGNYDKPRFPIFLGFRDKIDI